MPSKRCYYEVLTVSREATSDELRKAYRREALKHHPDRNPGDTTAEAKFKEVNEAYQVLTDDQKRRIYDQFGHAGLDGSMGGAGGEGMGDVFSHMQDLFAEMFSGGMGFGGNARPRRGSDMRVQARLNLREAAFGCKREVQVRVPATCGDCSGSGAKPGSKPESCPQCRGSGQVSNARGFVMFTSTCPRCRGAGRVIKQPCPSCSGHGAVERARKVNVTFPPGIDGGQRLRVPGQGMPGPSNSPAGDLYVEIDVEDDPRFERDGADLVTRVHIPLTDAALGAEIRVPALEAEDEDVTLPLVVPPGTQSSAMFTVKGQGIPRLDGRGRGSLVVIVQVDVPSVLTTRARELLEQLRAELKSDSNEPEGKRAAGGK
ncbi:MAG TPA: molecular chaperone DnaJ [Polyangiaceae bacterium]|jgi:molecular chaperone DnaJ|nr:molecular chaperone DnaJ [Polyangiaceae bacterium]